MLVPTNLTAEQAREWKHDLTRKYQLAMEIQQLEEMRQVFSLSDDRCWREYWTRVLPKIEDSRDPGLLHMVRQRLSEEKKTSNLISVSDIVDRMSVEQLEVGRSLHEQFLRSATRRLQDALKVTGLEVKYA